jgi:hypothetical protein
MKKKKISGVSPALVQAMIARKNAVAPAGNMPAEAPAVGPAGGPPAGPMPQAQPGAGGPPAMPGMKKGGSAHSRADGIAERGHTKGSYL